jgi:hypothetical protein
MAPAMSVLVTARCGACAVEHHHAPIVGHVVRRPNGVKLWISKRRGGIWAGATVLSHPLLSHPRVPDRLSAVCNRHGPGSVSTADVIDERGNVIIDFSASA